MRIMAEPEETKLHIVLYQPQIPQNTGNIARLCMAEGAMLHLIKPLGFALDKSALRRAGLDYWPQLPKRIHDDWHHFLQYLGQKTFSGQTSKDTLASEVRSDNQGNSGQTWFTGPPLFPLSTMGLYLLPRVILPERAYFLFGREDSGLPAEILNTYAQQSLTIPQRGQARSLNLANSAAIVLYEHYRQILERSNTLH